VTEAKLTSQLIVPDEIRWEAGYPMDRPSDQTSAVKQWVLRALGLAK